MFELSFWHIVILAVVVVAVLGRGRISRIMGDFGNGISAFRREMYKGSANPPLTALPDASKTSGPPADSQ